MKHSFLDHHSQTESPIHHLDARARIQSIPQTKIIVTHHLPAAVDLCERAVLLYEGRKIEDLSMGDLLGDRALLERFGFDAD